MASQVAGKQETTMGQRREDRAWVWRRGRFFDVSCSIAGAHAVAFLGFPGFAWLFVEAID
ncbi:hypothetical protein [Paraburkholderia sp. J10-1]|uniref:hypothetical protein n=1 Tax=Paraburkholderia sp. J10-1 TaxID=2805430 RepID=UPI002AB6F280|nr:hypothetical protein [Paraburkholderia sp. J10-1]